jgi:hypothetical protein
MKINLKKYIFALIPVLILACCFTNSFAADGAGETLFSTGTLTDPETYVIEKIKQYPVVGIGEAHWVQNQVSFVNAVIRRAVRERLVDCVALEFGSAYDQHLADEVVFGDTFSREKVLQILKSIPDLGWGYEDYIDIFKTLWEENKKLPKDRQVRIILTDNPFLKLFIDDKLDMKSVDMEQARGFIFNRNKFMADVISKDIVEKNLRVLYYAGSTHIGLLPTLPLIMTYDDITTGEYLNIRYPGKYFPIILHNFSYSEGLSTCPYAAGGIIEQELNKRQDKFFAMDLADTNLGRIKLGTFYGDNNNYGNASLQDIFKGYVFLGSLDNYKPVKRIRGYYADKDFMNYLQNKILKIIWLKTGRTLQKEDFQIERVLEEQKERPIFKKAPADN